MMVSMETNALKKIKQNCKTFNLATIKLCELEPEIILAHFVFSIFI